MMELESGMGIRLFGGVRLLFDKPEEARCPRCGRQVDAVKTEGIKWGLDYPVLWFIPLCDECDRELKDAGIPLSRKLRAVGLVGRLCDMTLEGFEPMNPELDRALRLAKSFVLKREFGLWFVGGCGTGKTHLAAGIVRELVRDRVPVLFRYVPSLLDELRDMVVDGTSEPIDRLVRRVDVLVLDDLGCEKRTDWAVERLTMIVNERVLGRQVTVVTSNLAPDEAALRLGDRIVSRLLENCRVVNMGEEDYRVRGKKRKRRSR